MTNEEKNFQEATKAFAKAYHDFIMNEENSVIDEALNPIYEYCGDAIAKTTIDKYTVQCRVAINKGGFICVSSIIQNIDNIIASTFTKEDIARLLELCGIKKKELRKQEIERLESKLKELKSEQERENTSKTATV